jgi:NAD(P)-dependent dehydrogenase (short-subunit alcohol dehydrogenase family)
MYGAIYGDLAKLDETVALAEHANRLGRFDAVIHNAGVLDAGDVLTVNTLAGHATQVWLATADDVDPPTGGYWYHRHVQDPHPATRDVAFQTELIRALEVRTGITLD